MLVSSKKLSWSVCAKEKREKKVKIILSRFRIIYHTIIFFKQVFKSTKSKLLQELLKLLKISSSKQTLRTKIFSMHLKFTIDIVGSEITIDATFVDNNICKPYNELNGQTLHRVTKIFCWKSSSLYSPKKLLLLVFCVV